MSTFKIDIDRDRCAGHGRCYGLAPELFEPDDDGFAVVLQAHVAAKFEGAVTRAKRNCPEGAVVVTVVEEVAVQEVGVSQ